MCFYSSPLPETGRTPPRILPVFTRIHTHIHFLLYLTASVAVAVVFVLVLVVSSVPGKRKQRRKNSKQRKNKWTATGFCCSLCEHFFPLSLAIRKTLKKCTSIHRPTHKHLSHPSVPLFRYLSPPPPPPSAAPPPLVVAAGARVFSRNHCKYAALPPTISAAIVSGTS